MSSTLFSRPVLEFGVYSQGVTPVTIPNTVVKTLNAYGTAGVTRWESRSMPNSNAGWGNQLAEVVKLVDTLDSKSSGGDPVPVRFRLSAPELSDQSENSSAGRAQPCQG